MANTTDCSALLCYQKNTVNEPWEPTYLQKCLYECAKGMDRDELIHSLVMAELKAGDMANRCQKLETSKRILSSNLQKTIKLKNTLKQCLKEAEDILDDNMLENENTTDYKALYEKQLEENLKLREEKTDLQEQIDELGDYCENLSQEPYTRDAYEVFENITAKAPEAQ